MARTPKAKTPPLHTSDVEGFSEDYLSVIAHDLRGSLNSIMGWAELVKRNALPEGGHVRAGETIIRQAKLQLDLINEMVDTWRLLSGNLQLRLSPIDARELIHQALEAVQDNASALRFEVDAQALPRPLFADSVRIRQVLTSLLTGAMVLAPKGGTIEVRVRPEDEANAEIIVHVAGAGIDAAEVAQILSQDRLRDRGAKTTARSKFGRGFGLIRDIVGLHGGTIKAEVGATDLTLRLTLPLAPAPSAVKVDKSGNWARDSRAGGRTRLAGSLFLIVDDDEGAREVVAAILKYNGARVVVAGSVSTALVALRNEQVDVLIADLGMPVEDGYDLIRQVRSSAIPRIAGVPAAALTAYTSEEDRDRALAAGFQFHLAKPVDPTVLVATVERLRSETEPVH